MWDLFSVTRMYEAIDAKEWGEEPTLVVPYDWADEGDRSICNERVLLFDWTRGGMAVLQDFDDPAPEPPRFCIERKNAPEEPNSEMKNVPEVPDWG